MPAVWRPPWYAWALLWVLALVTIHELFPTRLEGKWTVLTPLLLLAGVMAARRLWELPPAVAMSAAIVLTIFSNGWGQMGLSGMPLDRLLVVFALAQVFLRSPGAARMPPLRLRNVHLLMGLTVVYLIASAAAAGTLTTKTGALSVLDEFGATPYLAFLVAPAVFSGRRERNVLLATLVGLGLYLGFTAIFESLGPHSLVFPQYIVGIDAADPAERVNGPFQSSVAMGCGTFACGVAAMIALSQWRRRWQRWLAATAALVCVYGCFSTLQRGVWIAALSAVILAAIGSRAGRRWLVPGLLACALVIGGALAVVPGLAEKTSSRASYERSVWDRQNQTATGLRMVEARPLFGFGLDRYKSDSLDYFRQPSDYPMTGRVALDVVGEPETIQPLHNLYLAYAVELGLVGVSLWFATLLWGVGGSILGRGPAALRPWKLGLLAITVFFVTVTIVNPNQPPFIALLLWTWAGLVLGNAPRPSSAPRPAILRRGGDGVAWAPA